ncbi:thyroid receptor-interacting protein 11-like [Planoprotostelium fungivorum]|uniref:Thyroid receptor-interacting protein 11-like n=1 Tax=Planoprotostelium fungivorum TaxID=1890364 RepID=A0A2P6NIB5_9EUKA|nr:thyroid receptor-interacting protein 11-like [Planoprotostelium fungivorum]
MTSTETSPPPWNSSDQDTILKLKRELSRVKQNLDDKNGEIHRLEYELERRQDSYIRREGDYRDRIHVLENKLNKERSVADGMVHIRDMQRQVLSGINTLKQSKKDMERDFDDLVIEKRQELRKAQDANQLREEEVAEWTKTLNDLLKEVENLKQTAKKLDQENSELRRQNRLLSRQCKFEMEVPLLFVEAKKKIKELTSLLMKTEGALQSQEAQTQHMKDKINHLIIGNYNYNDLSSDKERMYQEEIAKLKMTLEIHQRDDDLQLSKYENLVVAADLTGGPKTSTEEDDEPDIPVDDADQSEDDEKEHVLRYRQQQREVASAPRSTTRPFLFTNSRQEREEDKARMGLRSFGQLTSVYTPTSDRRTPLDDSKSPASIMDDLLQEEINL